LPCESQESPDLNAPGSGPGETQFQRRGRTPKEQREYNRALRKLQYLERRRARGQPSYDALDYTGLGERMTLKELGLRWDGERLVKASKR
jgi:hypothetical protein